MTEQLTESQDEELNEPIILNYRKIPEKSRLETVQDDG